VSSWLCILNRENYEVVRNKLRWGVTERHKTVLARTNIGDFCAFYVISEGTGKSRKDPAIRGIFEIVSEPYVERSDIFPSKREIDEIYPYRVSLKLINNYDPEISFKRLAPKMDFILDKQKNYAGYFMGKAMREISAKDMETIIKLE
jgi:predicted RNA-binding protein